MCKVIAFTDTKKLNLKKSINSIGNMLLKLERDGFGYAVQGTNGVFGEKSIAKSFGSRFFTQHEVKLPIVKVSHERFGEVSPPIGPGIFHGRTSTNVKGLLNCHPMQRDNWHLIHNGVVDDHGPDYVKVTQNDSEDVLARLVLGIEHVERELEGYYAFAAIDPLGRLHVARDGIATLYVAYSPVYDSHIFATTESLLNSINKSLKAKIGPIDEVTEDCYMIFEGNTMVHCQSIKPRGYTSTQSAYASQSLGRSLDDRDNILDWGYTGYSKAEPISEDTWQNLSSGFGSEEEESVYYQLRHELDTMDASYSVFNEAGVPIELHEFKKMDHISQELCTILRGDGTVVNLESHMPNGERKLA